MDTVAIPEWNPSGVMPPIQSTAPTAMERSPYPVSLTDFVLRFSTTNKRRAILSGLLGFRAALHSAGLTEGFQRIDGSFIENIEEIESREPADVDVVTFFHLPPLISQQDLLAAHPRLFNPAWTKADFHVDAYFVQLNSNAPEPLVRLSTYWHSLWSHRRNGLWRGYLQIDMSPIDDETAGLYLEKAQVQESQS